MCRTLVLTNARAAVAEDAYPVAWTGTQAVVTLPERIGASDVRPLREQLLGLVDCGPSVLIADLTATVACDSGGADALRQAYQRTSGNGTQLRVAVSAENVRQVLEAAGLDRLIAIYPSVQAAATDETPAGVIPLVPRQARQRGERQVFMKRPARLGGDRLAGALGPAVLWGMINALADGVVLANDAGELVLANRRAEELFGYAPGELAGQRVESLVPARLRAAHVSQRAGYVREPTAREMGARARLAGLRQDGTTFPVRISLSPVQTATGRFTMAVIRDISDERPPADLGELARIAAAAEDARRGEELLGQVADGLFRVGLSLQRAADLPDEIAIQRIADAVQHVDDVIGDIRDYVFPGPVFPGPEGDRSSPHPPPDEGR